MKLYQKIVVATLLFFSGFNSLGQWGVEVGYLDYVHFGKPDIPEAYTFGRPPLDKSFHIMAKKGKGMHFWYANYSGAEKHFILGGITDNFQISFFKSIREFSFGVEENYWNEEGKRKFLRLALTGSLNQPSRIEIMSRDFGAFQKLMSLEEKQVRKFKAGFKIETGVGFPLCSGISLNLMVGFNWAPGKALNKISLNWEDPVLQDTWSEEFDMLGGSYFSWGVSLGFQKEHCKSKPCFKLPVKKPEETTVFVKPKVDINDRPTDIQKNLSIEDSLVEIEIWDGGQAVDDDIVSIWYHGTQISPEFKLTHEKQTFQLPLERDIDNLIQILAVSEGKYPPATVNIRLKTAGTSYEFAIRAWEEKNGAFSIKSE